MSSELTPNSRMRFGDGRISGAFSITLGAISLGGVLCFLFPEYLTTPEFRAQYNVEALRLVLAAGMIVSGGCALRSLVVNRSKRAGLIGGGLTLLALALGGANIEAREVAGSSAYLSLDYFVLSLLAMALMFVPLELFFPKNAEQTKFHPEWKTDLAYFAIGHLFVQGVAVMSQKPIWALFGSTSLENLQEAVVSLPFVVQVFLALLAADLFQYGMHRLFHRAPYLWRFHAVHHSTRIMDWLAGSRLHLIDVIATRMMVYLPLYVLGFDQVVLLTYVAVVANQAVLNHTNTRLPFGVLERLFVTPRIHHWHHSTLKQAHDKNFAVHFPWIDKLFGTYYAPAGEWPEAVGLNEASFPKGYLRQFAYPFLHDPEAESLKGEVSSR
jgi:sterol desaturase/sphingolipid hydroxylase (fatty acid hydroxylase superfamily)